MEVKVLNGGRVKRFIVNYSTSNLLD